MLLLQVSTSEFLPTGIGDWAALALSLAAIAGMFWKGGALREQLNGLGTRLTEHEKEVVAVKAKRDEDGLAIQRLNASHELLLQQITASVAASTACESNMQKYAQDVGGKIEVIHQDVGAMELHIVQRLVKVETNLENLMRKDGA